LTKYWRGRNRNIRFRVCAIGAYVGVAIGLMSVPGIANAATKIEKTFGPWRVICVEDNGAKQCSMVQSRQQARSKQVVVAWSVAKTPKGEVVNSVIVPAGISIPEGVRISVGDQKPSTLGYSICGPRACQATVNLDEAALASGQMLSVNYVRANKQLVQAQIDLKGYDEAYRYFVDQTQ
jgi:invasion protein IalB